MEKKTKGLTDYDPKVTKVHLCKHCRTMIVVRKDTPQIYCVNCKRYTRILPT